MNYTITINNQTFVNPRDFLAYVLNTVLKADDKTDDIIEWLSEDNLEDTCLNYLASMSYRRNIELEITDGLIEQLFNELRLWDENNSNSELDYKCYWIAYDIADHTMLF